MHNRDNRVQGIKRREFITRSVAAAVGGCVLSGTARGSENGFLPFPGSRLPVRPFGNTGAKVTLLTFGGGGPWDSFEESTALRILTEALDHGVNCIDTAYGYGNGKSEEYIGRLMPERRKDVLIHTKVSTRNKDLWWKHFETSLKRLKVDYVDTLMIHALGNADDLEKLEGKDGPFELLHRAKEQKLARWIGVSSHSDSRVLLEADKRHNFDHVLMSLNVATNGFTDMGFEEDALPVLARKGTAITAMKSLGAGRIVGKFPGFDYSTCLRYTLSLPSVATVAVTLPNLQHLSNDIEVVEKFQPFNPKEMAELKKKAEGELKTSFRSFMEAHQDSA